MSEKSVQLPSARKAFLALLTFIILFGALELTLRVSGSEFFETNQLFPLNRDISFTDIYDKDSELFWRLKKSITVESASFSSLRYQVNSSGFRGPDWAELKGESLVLSVGNSCTFGWAVPYDSIYSARLQSSGKNYRVLNCGTPGYSSYQGKILLRKLLAENQPRVVTLMFGWNDHWPAGSGIPDKDQKPLPQWALSLQNSLANLKTYQALRKITLSASSQNQGSTDEFSRVTGSRRVSLADFAANLKEMIELTRRSSAEPIILVPPVASLALYLPGVANSPFHDLHAEYQATTRRIAKRLQCEIIDLQPLFDEQAGLFDYPIEDPVHFNSAGHRIVANSILQHCDSLTDF